MPLLYTQSFSGGILGLAWVGTICDKASGGQALNAGLTTDLLSGEQQTSEEISLVTTHEVGHNWGSNHDLTSNCQPGK